MIAFSELLHFKLVDLNNQAVRLSDLAIDLSASDNAPVTDLLWSDEEGVKKYIPWGQVIEIDERRRSIRVKSMHQGSPAEDGWIKKAVLLKRDLLDSLMLDLNARTTILANDLWLEVHDKQLVLCAIDVSFRAILRRLSGGLAARSAPSRLSNWKYIEFFRSNPQAPQNGLAYHGLINRLPAGEVAYLADQLPYLCAAELLSLLPDQLAADTLEVMVPELQLQVYEELDPGQAQRILTLMRPDLAADLISRLEQDDARQALEHLPQEQASRVIELMQFPEDTAGGIMTNDMVTLPVDITVGEAISRLSKLLEKPDYINFIQVIYLVDNEADKRLQGALSLKELLVTNHEQKLSEMMNPYLITLQPLMPAAQAARRVIESAMAALPVIAQDGRIVGIIVVDSALSLTAPKKGRREVLRLYS